MSASGTFTGNVDDNADLAGWDFDLTTDYSKQTPGRSGGQPVGEFAEVRARGYADVRNPGGSRLDAEPGRTGGEPTRATYEGAGKSFSIANLLVAMILLVAQNRWQDGFCLEIVVTGVEESNKVDLGSASPFRAVVRHKIEGRELPLPIEASLSGDKSVEPTAKTNSPVDYRYTAGGKPAATATVALETRSRRGVAKKAVTFTTGELSWRPKPPWQGPAICSLEHPMVISMGGMVPETYRLTPDDHKDRQGTVSMTQQIGGGCEVRGAGTYTITVTEGEAPEADIRMSVTPTMYCAGVAVPRPNTVLHVLLEPYDDPSCP